MQLQLDDVALFTRIVELGTLSAAARERDVPVSQVTRALARLGAASPPGASVPTTDTGLPPVPVPTPVPAPVAVPMLPPSQPSPSVTVPPNGIVASSEKRPVSLWVSQPVDVNETVVVAAANAAATAVVQAQRLADDSPGSPLTASVAFAGGWTDVSPLQATTQSVKFVPPPQSAGVYAFRIIAANQVGLPKALFKQPTGSLLLRHTGTQFAAIHSSRKEFISLAQNVMQIC